MLPSLLFSVVLLVLDALFIRWAVRGGYAQTDALTFYVLASLLSGLTLALMAGLVYTVLSRFKGKLVIELHDRPFEVGDLLEGLVTVHLRQPLDVAGLTLTLVAKRHVRSDGQNRTIRIVDVGQDLLPIDEIHMLPAGTSEHVFEFEIPGLPRSPQRSALDGLVKPESLLGGLLDTAVDGKLTWSLEARLHVRGADLHATRRLRVNRRPGTATSASNSPNAAA